MKIGWYTHHLENDTKTSEKGLNGLFSGRFVGGAEMSDYEYRKQAPANMDITTVGPNTWIDPEEFDSVIVTGTDAFTDQQLMLLSGYKPFVFVHHLQTQRYSLKFLIDDSRMFVTHTPAHMMRELLWTRPKRTGQVLSYFDTSEIELGTDKFTQAVWAGRNHPLKGLLSAKFWAAQQKLPLIVHKDSPREDVLRDLTKSEWFVHLPLAFESECRTAMEAVLAGCKTHMNDFVGLTSVEDWHEPEVLKNMIDKAGETFWRLVLA
jgi:hypothetical protein